MRVNLPVLVLLALALAGIARAGDFDSRRQWMLERVQADWEEQAAKPGGNNRFYRAMALFEAGRMEEGRRLAHRGLDQLTPGNRENRWMFGGNTGFMAWPGIDLYLRCREQLGPELRERFRTVYTGAVFYPRLSTSNHKIMAAVTRYLATQEWGPEAFRPDPSFEEQHHAGSLFAKDDPTGEKYVRRIIADTLRQGPGEYASRPYGAENVLPLLTLAECATDETIRGPARLAYDLCLAQLAPAWLEGHLATFAPRSYPDMERQRPSGGAIVPWVYFGGTPPADITKAHAIRALLSAHRLPAPVITAATDRAKPYTHRALIGKWALTHYVNRDYALFSRSPKAGGPGFQGQSYPCGVMWKDADPGRVSQLWVTNPAADDNAMKGNEAGGLHTHGVTPYEQEVQYRDALLFVFDIPAAYRNPYVLGYIPGGARAVIDESRSSGRIFLHYGTVLIALSSPEPFTWEPSAGILAPSAKNAPGDSEFRIHRLRTAMAIETAHPDEFPGTTPEKQLQSFQAAIRKTSNIRFTEDGQAVSHYTDRHGNRLMCTFGGEDRVNDLPVDYAAWPALENPWMDQNPGGPLTVRDDRGSVVMDIPAHTGKK